MVFLEGFDAEGFGFEGAEGAEGGLGGGEGGHDGDALVEGGGADADFVLAGDGAGGGVDDEGDFAVLEHVEDVGAAFVELEEAHDGDAGGFERGGGAGGAVDPEAEGMQAAGEVEDGGFVGVADADEDVAGKGERRHGGHLRLGVGEAEVVVDAHDFAGRFHFGAEEDVGAAEFGEGEDGFLERVVGGDDFLGEAEVFAASCRS